MTLQATKKGPGLSPRSLVRIPERSDQNGYAYQKVWVTSGVDHFHHMFLLIRRLRAEWSTGVLMP